MKKFKISVPVINETVTEENRPQFLALLKRAEADRIFLAFNGVYACDIPLLHQNINFFRENGFEVGLWVGHTLGHTGDEFDFAEKDRQFQPIIRRDGVPFKNTFCPYDQNFQRSIGEKLAEILRDADVKFVMFDDDCTLSQKGFGCTCEKHLNKMAEFLGEKLSREEIAERAFSGEENPYRTAWLRAQGDSIREFCESIRRKVNEVRPDISLSLCTVSAHRSFDGLDSLKVNEILSGEGNPRFNRLHGAPYWANGGKYSATYPFEVARMYSAHYRGENIETFAEGDVYPRPRNNCSAARLELLDAVVRADGGYDGILKYMISYTHNPEQEKGYIDRHVRDLPALEKILEFFPDGANTGVNIRMTENLAWTIDMDDDHELFNPPDMGAYPRAMGLSLPDAGQVISQSSIPTVYNRSSLCDGIFGDNARYFGMDTVEEGAVIDARAAKIYEKNGTDVGLRSFGKMEWRRILSVREPGFTDGDPLIQNDSANTLVLEAELKEGCIPVLLGQVGSREIVLAYTYMNADGKKLLVLLMDGCRLRLHNSGIPGSYSMQRVMKKAVRFLSGQDLPLEGAETPGLYVMVRRDADSMSILFCNYSEDLCMEPEYTLPEAYSSVECVNGNAEVNGRSLKFRTDIPAFGFAAVCLKREDH